MFELHEVTVVAHAFARTVWEKAEEAPGVSVDYYRPERKNRSIEYNKVTSSSFRRLSMALENKLGNTCDVAVTVQFDPNVILTYFDVR